MRHLHGVLVLPAICLVASATVGLAQTSGATTGTIDGTLTDVLGGALPGVRVTAMSDALMVPRVATSEPDGTYLLAALPPGRYSVSFALAGFESRRREAVPVGPGVTTTVDERLTPAGPREEVVVTNGAGAVDRRSTVIATAFDIGELTRLPGNRTIGALLAATPAVQLTRFDVGGSTAFGVGPFSAYGTSGHNRPTLDGISVSNMNPLGFAPDYGALAHVSVGTAAYGPEWPSPGLHVRLVTKSGGNHHTGSALAAYEHEAWQAFNIDLDQVARGAPSAATLDARHANRLRSYRDLGADAGGYVRPDRLWWYGATRDHGSSARQVIFSTAPLETRVTSLTGKATWRPIDDHRVTAFAHRSRNWQPIRLDGFLRAASAVNTTLESTSAQLATGLVWKAEWTTLLAQRVFIEARVGQFTARRAERPNGDAPRTEDLFRADVSGGNRDWLTDWRSTQISGGLTYYRSGLGGHHEMKAGVQLERLESAEEWRRGYPGDVLHVTRNGIPREVYLFQTPSRSESGQWWYAVHVADVWRVRDRLTLNLGLRLDRFRSFLPAQQHAAGRFNPTPVMFGAVSNVAAWNVAAPRLAAGLDVRGDGRTVLKASYGLHWLPPSTSLGFNVNPNARVWRQRFKWADTDDDGLWRPGEEFDLLDSRGGETTESIDPDLQLAYIHEATVRLEQEAAARLVLATGLVWRGERQQGARQRSSWPFEAFTVPVTVLDPGPDGVRGTDDDGADIQGFELPPDLLGRTQTVIRNPEDADSDYVTWEVTARRLGRRLSLSAAFAHTWNRDHASGYAGQAVRANEYPATPNDFIHTDAEGRHRYRNWSFRAYATFHGPWALVLTPFVRHQSGQAFGRTLAASLNHGTIRVLAEPIGARRQDHVTLVDVRIEKAIRPSGSRRLTTFVEIFNVLNAHPEQNVSWETGDTFLRPLAIVPPRIARLGFRLDW